MWNCANCGRLFANRNQSHACSALGDLDRHFRGKEPVVRATFDRLLEEAERLGPLTLLPEKTRIALQVRMSFAAFSPRRRWLDGHVVLGHRLHSLRFRRVETYSPRNVLHAFRLCSPAEVDAEVISWLAEAYAVGEQRHLESSPGSP
jgi:hypothetical protein